jgi:hypothetical protein
MCWSATASVAMVGAGIVATSMTFLCGHPRGIWMPMGYFTIMEALQAAGYSIVYVQRHGTRRPWLVQLLARRSGKTAIVALANKMARMAWALMVSGEAYREPEIQPS